MSDHFKLVLIIMAVMSVIGFFAMGIDKIKAKRDMWRTPERILLGIALFGGGAGVWLGMEVFHHKTKHWYFKFGVPIIFIAEILGLFLLFGI